MNDKDRVGVVIVGTGVIARFHAKAVQASEMMRLVAAVDLIAERVEKFAAEFGCEAMTDLDAALSRADVGMVVVATPSGAHDDAVLAAAKHRVPVLVEKPLAITYERAKAMIEACAKTATPLGGIFQTRWTDAITKVREALQAGKFGRVTFARVDVPWWREDSYYQGSWHGTKKMDGGGALMNQAIHMVDWLVDLMPAVKSVKPYCATIGHEGIETEDTVSAALEFENGALGQIYATTSSWPGRPKRLEITGTKGTAVIEDHQLVFWKIQGEEDADTASVNTQGGGSGASRPEDIDFVLHQRCFESFVRSLKGGERYPVDGETAAKSVEIIERIYKESAI